MVDVAIDLPCEESRETKEGADAGKSQSNVNNVHFHGRV